MIPEVESNKWIRRPNSKNQRDRHARPRGPSDSGRNERLRLKVNQEKRRKNNKRSAKSRNPASLSSPLLSSLVPNHPIRTQPNRTRKLTITLGWDPSFLNLFNLVIPSLFLGLRSSHARHARIINQSRKKREVQFPVSLRMARFIPPVDGDRCGR